MPGTRTSGRRAAVAVLAFCGATVAAGLATLHARPSEFLVLVDEDQPVEWATFGILVAAVVLAARRRAAVTNPGARRVWTLVTLAALFGALEEISYGQRVFGWASPAWFLAHNRQQETNVHNLVAWGVNINRVVFGKGITLAAAVYLLVLAPLARRPGRWAATCARTQFPLPRLYQVVAYLAMALSVLAHRYRTDEVNELTELAGCGVLLSILLDPGRPAGVDAPEREGA